MSNPVLARAAKAAMKDDSITAERGMCSRFVRQVCAKIYGPRFAAMFGKSAKVTALNFVAAGYGHSLKSIGGPNCLQLGDILFKTKSSGEYGHVGIFTGEGKIAENSSTRLGRVSGAKGFRTLSEFAVGAVDIVVRLPEPTEKPK